ncbi:hypothetical protein MKK58_24355 [Methylobacterium sp. J-078]|uniref:hypothetical protein n=1 Tax=Methylobacterium sp. J-078 TaxID=2836657 RepID=UPI001FBA6BC4|nr:hypothetical protein [Methylobacterium sp. J-078]MCJ2047647.1 hypothetical protein [Methylobacterium sp. J-078]
MLPQGLDVGTAVRGVEAGEPVCIPLRRRRLVGEAMALLVADWTAGNDRAKDAA